MLSHKHIIEVLKPLSELLMYDYVFNSILLDNLILDIQWEIIFSISILLIDEWLVSKRQIIGKICEQLMSKNNLWLNWLSLWYEM